LYDASAGSARMRDRTGRKLLREVVIRRSCMSAEGYPPLNWHGGDLPWTLNFIKLLSLTIENYRRVMGVGRNAAYASLHRGVVETMRVAAVFDYQDAGYLLKDALLIRGGRSVDGVFIGDRGQRARVPFFYERKGNCRVASV
jgi:hypothetical protein